jgi:cytochrome c553
MRFILGFITGIIVTVAALAALAFTYDVAATARESSLDSEILRSVMENSVRAHAGTEGHEAWTDDEVHKGFKEYDAMCVVCHAAPGKERGPISKGMRPQPPNLAEASKQWTPAQLFWIVKNGINMTGMPAFGATHSDEQIWNIVGFVRRLPGMTPDEYNVMESKSASAGERKEEGRRR